MTTTPTTSTTNTSTNTNSIAGATAQSASSLQNEFMQILLTQLQNQNPMDPIKPEDFASQLAQFSALEQQVDTNTKLDTLISNTGTNNISPVSYLGNTVEYSSSTAPVQNSQAQWNYSATGAATITLTVTDASGNQVYTTTGDTSSGIHSFSLPTSDFSSQLSSTVATADAADGTPLTLTVSAVDSSGNAVTPTVTSLANITAVDSSSGTTSLEASGYVIDPTTITRLSAPASAASAISDATSAFTSATSAFTSVLSAITSAFGA